MGVCREEIMTCKSSNPAFSPRLPLHLREQFHAAASARDSSFAEQLQLPSKQQLLTLLFYSSKQSIDVISFSNSTMKIRLPQRLQAQHSLPMFSKQHVRALSLSAPRSSNQSSTPTAPAPTTNNARWLSDIKARIGKCIMFGMSKEQTKEAATVMKAIGAEWRALVAGREGFLVGRKRAGLLRQAVVWGEMDRMVCSSLLWETHMRRQWLINEGLGTC